MPRDQRRQTRWAQSNNKAKPDVAKRVACYDLAAAATHFATYLQCVLTIIRIHRGNKLQFYIPVSFLEFQGSRTPAQAWHAADMRHAVW